MRKAFLYTITDNRHIINLKEYPIKEIMVVNSLERGQLVCHPLLLIAKFMVLYLVQMKCVKFLVMSHRCKSGLIQKLP